MSPDYLKYFVAACECGSIQSAAKFIFVSAQGLSQGIKRLEESVGIQLLERQQTGVVPTQFGRIFYEQACMTLREFDKLENLAERYRSGLNRTLVVGTIGRDKFSEGIPACAASYRRRFTDVDFRVEVAGFDSCDALYAAVRSGEADLGLLFHAEESPEFDYYSISAYSNVGLLTCSDNPLAQKPYVTWNDLSDIPLIAAADTDPFRALIDTRMQQNQAVHKIAFTTTNASLIARLVSMGEASVLFRAAYCDEILHSTPNIVFRELHPAFPITISFISHTTRPFNRDTSAFRDYMIDYFKRIVIGGL